MLLLLLVGGTKGIWGDQRDVTVFLKTWLKQDMNIGRVNGFGRTKRVFIREATGVDFFA